MTPSLRFLRSGRQTSQVKRSGAETLSNFRKSGGTDCLTITPTPHAKPSVRYELRLAYPKDSLASELDYAGQISWLLFLKYLHDLESKRQENAEHKGKNYRACNTHSAAEGKRTFSAA